MQKYKKNADFVVVVGYFQIILSSSGKSFDHACIFGSGQLLRCIVEHKTRLGLDLVTREFSLVK